MSDFPNSENPKPRLRQEALAIRQTLPMVEISRNIRQHLSRWEKFQKAERVLFYYPYRNELDLLPLAADFPEKAWYLPRISEDNRMVFHRYQPGMALTLGKYGIPEPPADSPWLDFSCPNAALPGSGNPSVRDSSSPATHQNPELSADTNLIILPGLRFDRQGYRLGYGKGYYDRYLSELSGALLVGGLPRALLTDELPKDAWDKPVHYLVTEEGLVGMNSGPTEPDGPGRHYC